MGEDYSKTFGGRRSFVTMNNEEIFALSRQKVENGKHFLVQCLSRDSLGEEISVYRNFLSRMVTRIAGVSFPVWLVSYRIAEVERLVSQS